MTATKITDYLGRGLHSARPATPPVQTGGTAIYYETDTPGPFIWDGSAWQVVSGGGGGGGYPAGTVPTVVQFASNVGGGNSVTFGATPTSGNLLVAMCFNPASGTNGSGWTTQVSNSSGTDFGVILTKVCGGSESTTQSPLTGVSTTGCMAVWEIHGQAGSNPFVLGQCQSESFASTSIAVVIPNSLNCIGLAACGVVNTGSDTITNAINVGTQSIRSNTAATRLLEAGYTDLTQTPTAGFVALFSGTLSSKAATCLITS